MPLQETSGAASFDAFGGGAAAVPVYIEDIFSCFLYTGNGTTQTITNGIDLSGKGGLVWLKSRSGATNHNLMDTSRGMGFALESNTTAAQQSGPYTTALSTGFSINNSFSGFNASGSTYVSWTFREQPKFFDVVTYTGNGSNRTISHNLGSVPGCIIVKRTNGSGNWQVYHRGLTSAANIIQLNDTAAQVSAPTVWNSTDPTSTVFSVGTGSNVNASGGTYVAYLFAHDAGGFGLTGTDNVISCGSFTTDGSGNATVSLGYEPQWILYKDVTSASNWVILDTMRGWTNPANNARLAANTTNAEAQGITNNSLFPTATGFGTSTGGLAPSSTYIYIAIRRGPMKTPTSGTTVFKPITYVGNGSTNSITGMGFPPDLLMGSPRNFNYSYFVSKLAGVNRFMQATNVEAETITNSGEDFTSFNQDGFSVGIPFYTAWNNNGTDSVMWNFRRAPGFFDVVCYTGTGSNLTVVHNLAAVPELMIVKARETAGDWTVWQSSFSILRRLRLNTNAAINPDNSQHFGGTLPTSSVFYVGSTNSNPVRYVAYLFATVAGVSKVGSYTGTGTTQVINCGFTAGSRFVMIKRTDSTGDWYVWDSARGIVAGNDPYILLNSTAAEVTNTDYVDTANSGFEISSTAPAAINANGGTFIFLAIA